MERLNVHELNTYSMPADNRMIWQCKVPKEFSATHQNQEILNRKARRAHLQRSYNNRASVSYYIYLIKLIPGYNSCLKILLSKARPIIKAMEMQYSDYYIKKA